jgi:hypothetical protein
MGSGAPSGPGQGPDAAAPQCDVSLAGRLLLPRPRPLAPAGASRGIQRDRAGPNIPGGRYLVSGHRAKALKDGQDVLLAGVPHGCQKTKAPRAPPTGYGRGRAVAASRRPWEADGAELRVTTGSAPTGPAHNLVHEPLHSALRPGPAQTPPTVAHAQGLARPLQAFARPARPLVRDALQGCGGVGAPSNTSAGSTSPRDDCFHDHSLLTTFPRGRQSPPVPSAKVP